MKITSLTDLPNLVEWPSEASWILQQLKPYTFDPLTERPFSLGRPRQCREWWLIGGARGVVTLDPDDWAALSDFARDVIGNALIVAQLPQPYGCSLVTFTRGMEERPTLVVKREFITKEGQVYDVAVDLIVHGAPG
jgi:hypothetical protein